MNSNYFVLTLLSISINAFAMMDTPIQQYKQNGLLLDPKGKVAIEFSKGTKVFATPLSKNKDYASVVVFGVVEKSYAICGKDDKIKNGASIYQYFQITEQKDKTKPPVQLHKSGPLFGKAIADIHSYCVGSIDGDENKFVFEIEGESTINSFELQSFPEFSVRNKLNLKNPNLDNFSDDFKKFSFEQLKVDVPGLIVYQLWTARGISPSPGLEMVLGFYKKDLVFIAHLYDDLPLTMFKEVKPPFESAYHLKLHYKSSAPQIAIDKFKIVLKSVLEIP